MAQRVQATALLKGGHPAIEVASRTGLGLSTVYDIETRAYE